MACLLAPTQRRLEGLVAEAQAVGRAPSIAAGVLRDGELVWFGGRGRHVTATAGDRPTADTQYRIGSITKPMTAMLIMQLRDEGLLSLDDRVDDHLPDAPWGDRRIVELLAHAAGLPAEPGGPWWERSEGVDFPTLADTHRDAPQVWESGRRFHYSNIGYGLLGEVVARLRGLSWWKALHAHLLGPLEMTRTTMQPRAPHATGLSVHPLADVVTVEPATDMRSMAPAGQLWSTVADLVRWLAFVADPHEAVLAPETVAEMTTPRIGQPDDALQTGYGLGLDLYGDEDPVLVGHGGSVPGFVAGVAVDRDSGVGGVVLANAGYGLPSGLLRNLVGTVLESEPPLPDEWLPVERLPDATMELVGAWHWGNARHVLRARGEQLVLEPAGGVGRAAVEFEAVATDHWRGTTGYWAGEDLKVVRRPDGTISHLDLATFVFTRIPYDPDAPIPGGT